MRKLLSLLLAISALGATVFISCSTQAQGISQKVGVCDPAYTARCIKPDASGAIPVTVTGDTAAVPSTDASSTVTLGNTYQTVFASSTTRKGCTIQNPATATETLNVRTLGTAVFTIPIGASFQCGAPGNSVISDIVAVTAATTGHAFTAVSQ